jgi:transcription initiation factor TFIID subunit TAF12
LFKDFKELEIKVKEMGEKYKKSKEKNDEEKNNI